MTKKTRKKEIFNEWINKWMDELLDYVLYCKNASQESLYQLKLPLSVNENPILSYTITNTNITINLTSYWYSDFFLLKSVGYFYGKYFHVCNNLYLQCTSEAWRIPFVLFCFFLFEVPEKTWSATSFFFSFFYPREFAASIFLHYKPYGKS